MLWLFTVLFLGLLPELHAAEMETLEYTIKHGDWLAKIAKNHDTSWQLLAKANNIPDPDRIYPGQVITIQKTVPLGHKNVAYAETPTSALSCNHTMVFEEIGRASWYGVPHHGRTTASGEVYNMHKYTVAHPTIPLGTIICISRNATGRSVRAKVNDRIPFAHAGILNVSKRIAEYLDIARHGAGEVKISVIVAAKQKTHRYMRRHAHLRKAPDATQPVTLDHKAMHHVTLSPVTTPGNVTKDRGGTMTESDRGIEIRAFLQEQLGPPYNTNLIENAMLESEAQEKFIMTFLFRDQTHEIFSSTSTQRTR